MARTTTAAATNDKLGSPEGAGGFLMRGGARSQRRLPPRSKEFVFASFVFPLLLIFFSLFFVFPLLLIFFSLFFVFVAVLTIKKALINCLLINGEGRRDIHLKHRLIPSSACRSPPVPLSFPSSLSLFLFPKT
jgi:hypothetical protein